MVRGLRRSGLSVEDFVLAEGECLPVCGPSGAGKTLLLRALADLDPHEGELVMHGHHHTDMPASRWRWHVAWVPAEAAWWETTVAEHFAEPDRLPPLAEALGLPADCGAWPVSRLSTGERQRLALARALALEPTVLLLDEPTSGLDSDAALRVEALLEAQRGRGVAMLWVTHDTAQASRLNAQRLLRVNAGRAVIEKYPT